MPYGKSASGGLQLAAGQSSISEFNYMGIKKNIQHRLSNNRLDR
jgi:hypothetical protein